MRAGVKVGVEVVVLQRRGDDENLGDEVEDRVVVDPVSLVVGRVGWQKVELLRWFCSSSSSISTSTVSSSAPEAISTTTDGSSSE